MSVPGGVNPLLLSLSAGVTPPAGYLIERSLRFNSSDSGYCSRTPASAGNRKTWTWAGWVKRSALGANQSFFVGYTAQSDTGYTTIEFSNTDLLRVSGWNTGWRRTTQAFRDTSAWYHIVVSWDTTQATSSDRIKIYVNGAQVTSFDLTNDPSLNADGGVNAAASHYISSYDGTNYLFSGYLADIHFIDGQALDPTSFGEFDTNGIWQPKAYTGTYGTNGFHLPFSDNSTAAALGTDTSGAGNNWTVNNISVAGQSLIGYPQGLTAGSGSVTDQLLAFDGSTATFAVASTSDTITFTPPSPLSFSSKLEFYAPNGNGPGSNDQRYSYNGGAEVVCSGLEWTTVVNGSGTLSSLSIRNTAGSISRLSAIRVDNSILIYNSGAGNDSLVDVPTNGTETDTGVGGEVRGNYATLNPLAGAPTLSNGNLDWSIEAKSAFSTIGVTSGKYYAELTMGANSAWVGLSINPNSRLSTSGSETVFVVVNDSTTRYAVNSTKSLDTGATFTTGDIIGIALDAGAKICDIYKNNTKILTFDTFTIDGPYFIGIDRSSAISGTHSINFGQRPFAYTAPSGFKALCTANLPAPVVTKPSEYMDVVTYTGNGSTQTISGLDFSPDLVWIKNRAAADSHKLTDTVRGATEELESDTNAAEATNADGLTAFNSDGFDLGADAEYNTNTETYVAWTWDAGSSNVTNNDGSITSTVRANATAGFSVATLTTPSSGTFTFGHGLGASPQLVICKSRTSAYTWIVYHKSAGAGNYLVLNTTAASAASATVWQNTDPSSTLVYGDTTNWGASEPYVVYSFSPVDGYSTSFSYTGNGNADGPFSYLGFLPKLILIKCSSTTGNWVLLDTEREGYNVDNDPLFPNLSNAEATTDLLDITSNGFKVRSTNADVNTNAATYVGFAWAESPFQYSRAR